MILVITWNNILKNENVFTIVHEIIMNFHAKQNILRGNILKAQLYYQSTLCVLLFELRFHAKQLSKCLA